MDSPVDLISGATSTIWDGITAGASQAAHIMSVTATGASQAAQVVATGASQAAQVVATGASQAAQVVATGASHIVSVTATGASQAAQVVYSVFGTPVPLPTIRFTPDGGEGTVTFEQPKEEPIGDFELVDAPTPEEMQALRTTQHNANNGPIALDALQLNVEWALFEMLAPTKN